MYRTASPYVKELQKGEIEWHSFSNETINKAIKEDKPIFVHIGNISNIEQRNRAYRLFSTPDVIKVLKEEFISIAIDTEDVPEIYLIGLDLLLINEKKISVFISDFMMRGRRGFVWQIQAQAVGMVRKVTVKFTSQSTPR